MRLRATLIAIVLSLSPIVVSAQVGYREITYKTPVRTVRAAIWYPSNGTPTIKAYAYTSGSVVINGPLPSLTPAIIVLSHGLWECGVGLAYVAQSLAASGYFVIAPDHEDAAYCLIGGGTAPTAGTYFTYPHRASDLRGAIDAVGFSAPVIAAGHSVGGWTALAIDGSQPLESDPRVRAALLLSASANSGATYYGNARSPVLYLYGGLEGDKTAPYLASHAPKYDDILPLAGHYAFTDKTCTGWTSVETCIVGNGFARRVVEMSRAFVSAVLGGSTATLHTSDMWAE